jgi:hypothetical protein
LVFADCLLLFFSPSEAKGKELKDLLSPAFGRPGRGLVMKL